MAAGTQRSFYRPEGELDDELVRNYLRLVGEDAPLEAVSQWCELERMVVVDWALREHLGASDNPIHRRPRPAGLLGPKT